MQRGTLQLAMKIVAAGACHQEPRRFVLINIDFAESSRPGSGFSVVGGVGILGSLAAERQLSLNR